MYDYTTFFAAARLRIMTFPLSITSTAKKKKKNVASTKNIASSEKVSEVESEAEDDGTL